MWQSGLPDREEAPEFRDKPLARVTLIVLNLGVGELGGEEVEAGVAVLGGVDDGLAVDSALGDVVGEVGEDAAWVSRQSYVVRWMAGNSRVGV
jgi:hypothetical protein